MEGGILSPPGETVNYPVHYGLTITPNDINANKGVVGGREAILPYIGGCINYQLIFGERRRYQTGFIYELLGPETFIFLDGGNIPINKLTLIDQDGAWAD
jgi:hypothetical protein